VGGFLLILAVSSIVPVAPFFFVSPPGNGNLPIVGVRSKPLETVEDLPNLTLDLDDGVTMKFVQVPSGTFTMGSPSFEQGHKPDETQHTVILTRPFWMQTTEVTQAQWGRVTGDANPSYHGSHPENPVEQLTWEHCRTFIKRLNETHGGELKGLRADLPTEAEWEYACRAGSTTRWSFGEDESALAEYAWFSFNSQRQTHPVAGKKPNSWGLYDMHGNVFEWCSDWYGIFPAGETMDPTGPIAGLKRVVRGGGWSVQAWESRSACRTPQPESWLNSQGGMRVVLR
jgi:formylglycine-generating enzyme required for sulfatase activity